MGTTNAPRKTHPRRNRTNTIRGKYKPGNFAVAIRNRADRRCLADDWGRRRQPGQNRRRNEHGGTISKLNDAWPATTISADRENASSSYATSREEERIRRAKEAREEEHDGAPRDIYRNAKITRAKNDNRRPLLSKETPGTRHRHQQGRSSHHHGDEECNPNACNCGIYLALGR